MRLTPLMPSSVAESGAKAVFFALRTSGWALLFAFCPLVFWARLRMTWRIACVLPVAVSTVRREPVDFDFLTGSLSHLFCWCFGPRPGHLSASSPS